MVLEGKVLKIGNSKGFIVPAEFLNKYGIQEDDVIQWEFVKVIRSKKDDTKNL